MQASNQRGTVVMITRRRGMGRRWLRDGAGLLFAVCCLTGTGCAAMTNPVGIGIPVSRLPDEHLAPSAQGLNTIPLTTLRQNPPVEYRLDAGDVLGVYIEGILGDKAQPPPVRFAEEKNIPPAIGFPIPVREDGTLPLPQINPINVRGMTVAEAEQVVHEAYLVPKKLIRNDAHVFLSLTRRRTYRVQVVREDAGGGTPTAGGGLVQFQRRNTGTVVDLPAYENDVLNALDHTGGLPGSEGLDEVVIERALRGGGTKVTHIPLKMHNGEPIPFRVEDVILENGDVVFVPGRRGEVFYTGGLLLPRQFVIPRDYDLHVVNAICLGGGPIVNGAISQNNLTGTVTSSGIGSPNPSRVTVIRRTRDGGQIPISVNLNLALAEPGGRENIIIQGGDVIILQETIGEATTRYLLGILHLNYESLFLNNSHNTGSFTASGP
jgi:protein involved in polysaccharide export with SLBB domain